MKEQENTKKQMKLGLFCKEYDVAVGTAMKWIHSKGFPAYKLGGCWYVDIEKFLSWREEEHQRSYKWA